jgi:hypothetical protein
MPISTISNSGISATAAISTSKLGTGAVLQVVNATLSTQTTITAQPGNTPANFADLGLSASITPSSTSSKILVFTTVPGLMVGGSSGAAYGWGIQICNSSNTILYGTMGDGGGPLDFWSQTGGSQINAVINSKQFLHSPSTTSSYTYKIRVGVRQDGGSGTPEVRINYGQSGYSGGTFSSITLMEIAG